MPILRGSPVMTPDRAAALLLLVAFGPSSVPDRIVLRDDVSHDESVAAARAYPGLAHLNLFTPNGIREGEAAFIHPSWLLTAAHVTGGLEEGHEVSVGAETGLVAEVIPHPGWVPHTGGGPDLALVRLKEPIRGESPVRIHRDRNEVGLNIVLLGLGDHGTGLTGPLENDGRVRMATNRIDAVDQEWIMFDFDPPSSTEATPYEGVAGPGDSGGPALAEIGGIYHLIGVSSRQSLGSASGPGRYGVIEHYTRVSMHVDWIDEVMAGR